MWLFRNKQDLSESEDEELRALEERKQRLEEEKQRLSDHRSRRRAARERRKQQLATEVRFLEQEVEKLNHLWNISYFLHTIPETITLHLLYA